MLCSVIYCCVYCCICRLRNFMRSGTDYNADTSE